VSYFSTLPWENKLLFEWVSDCYLTPSELFFNLMMWEQKLKNSSIGINQQSLTQKVTCSPMIKLKNSSIGIKQPSFTHSKSNLLLFFNFMMGEQVTFWVSEWVSDCYLTPSWAIFQLYHGRTSYFLSKWLLFNAKWAIFQLYHGRTSYFLSGWK
jgi:hypothetical protein